MPSGCSIRALWILNNHDAVVFSRKFPVVEKRWRSAFKTENQNSDGLDPPRLPTDQQLAIAFAQRKRREGSARGYGLRVAQSTKGSDSWVDDPITRHIISLCLAEEDDNESYENDDMNILWPIVIHTKALYNILVLPLVEPREMKDFVNLCNRSDCGSAVGEDLSLSSLLLNMSSITGAFMVAHAFGDIISGDTAEPEVVVSASPSVGGLFDSLTGSIGISSRPRPVATAPIASSSSSGSSATGAAASDAPKAGLLDKDLLRNFIATAMPFGTPLDLSLSNIFAMKANGFSSAEPPHQDLKQPAWKPYLYKGKQRLLFTIHETINAAMYDRDEIPDSVSVAGQINCRAELEGLPDVSFPLAGLSKARIESISFHPCAQVPAHGIDKQNIVFQPPLGNFVLMRYQAGCGLGPPVKGFYQLSMVSEDEGAFLFKVVVLGSGWSGYSFLSYLNNPNYDVQVVSPRNFFLFTPLLPSVTNGTVEARSIVEPIRGLMRKKGFEYTEAECVKIDATNKKIHCRSKDGSSVKETKEFDMDYDILVIAVGAKPNTFNTPGVEENAYFLKEAEDALKIRQTVINCFERASIPDLTEEDRKKILHFVVVGGGPTGVEFSAELHDFLVEDVAKIYPKVQEFTRITLLEAGDHILNMFDKRITAFAEEKFQRDGIDLKTKNMVVGVTADEISTKEIATGKIVSEPYGMVVWSTGIGIRPVIKEFMHQIGQGQRRVLATDEWLRVEGCDSVYALGDTATINQRRVMEDIAAIFSKADKGETGTLNKKEFKNVVKDICQRYPQVELYLKKKKLRNIANLLKSANGDDTEVNIETFKQALSEVDTQMKNLPATAQVASQQGKYLAKCFNKMEKCEKKPEGPLRFRGEGRHRFQPFRYRHFGSFAPLGGEQTAAELPGDWVSIGHSSQWLWYSVYASKLVSWRTRSLVVSDWVRRFIFGRDSSSI